MKLPLYLFEKVRSKQRNTTSYEVAELVSIIFDPLIVTIASLCVILGYVHPSVAASVGWFTLFIGVSVIPTVVYILVGMKSRRIHDWFLTKREERYKVLGVALISLIALNSILWALGSPALLLLFAQASLLQAVILSSVTFYWKISFHASFYSFFCSSILLLFGGYYWFLFLLLPVIGWSRTTLKKHTWGQIGAGSLVSVLVTLFMFKLYGYV